MSWFGVCCASEMRTQTLASRTRLYITSRAHGSHHMTFPPNPHASTTRVWCIDLNASLAALLMLEAETPRLSDVDRSRASRFSSGQAAREWMAAHVALRLVLEHSLGSGARRIPFRVSPSGKPDLPDSGIAFSLSHGAGHALIATGAVGPLGVDIEGSRTIRMAGDRRTSIEFCRRRAQQPGFAVRARRALPAGMGAAGSVEQGAGRGAGACPFARRCLWCRTRQGSFRHVAAKRDPGVRSGAGFRALCCRSHGRGRNRRARGISAGRGGRIARLCARLSRSGQFTSELHVGR